MKRKRMAVICLFMVSGMIMGCAAQTKAIIETAAETEAVVTDAAVDIQEDQMTEPYQKITAEEGNALMLQGDITVVDVRRMDEYETFHIPGAISIPNEEIGDTRAKEWPALDETILVYCRSGVRSKQAADKLVEMGYQRVLDMGGIVDWPYDTVAGREPGVFAGVEAE